jgi:hypothetical protein
MLFGLRLSRPSRNGGPSLSRSPSLSGTLTRERRHSLTKRKLLCATLHLRLRSCSQQLLRQCHQLQQRPHLPPSRWVATISSRRCAPATTRRDAIAWPRAGLCGAKELTSYLPAMWLRAKRRQTLSSRNMSGYIHCGTSPRLSAGGPEGRCNRLRQGLRECASAAQID